METEIATFSLCRILKIVYSIVDYDNKKSEILGTLAGAKIMAVTLPEKSSIGFVFFEPRSRNPTKRELTSFFYDYYE